MAYPDCRSRAARRLAPRPWPWLCLLLATAMAAPAAALAAGPAPQLRQVHPLFYANLADGKQIGEARPMQVQVEPSGGQGVRLGFFESEFFGVGAQWRAAGWMAAVVAALESAEPLSHWRISFDVPGLIDGPSAGGLMTATLISAMQGRQMLPSVTMTGTINPDGSIGPVSGIYYKLAGAQEKGIKKVLIPAGSRMEKQNDGSVKDLLARGRELGVEVVEVADVEAAYRNLSGQNLANLPDDGRDLAMPEKVRQALERSCARWEAKFNEATGRMRQTAPQMPAKYHPRLDFSWKTAQMMHGRAAAARQQGNLCAAMPLMFLAAVGADAGAHLSYLYLGLERGGEQEMMKVFKGYLIKPAFLDSFQNKLNQQKPRNLNDLMALAEGYAYYDAALGTLLYTEKMLKNLGQLTKEAPLLQIVENITLGEAMARNLFYFVDDLLLMGMGHPGRPLKDPGALVEWAKGMHLAAGANLGYIDRAIIEPAAQEAGVDPNALKFKLLAQDSQYQLANLCYQAVPVLLRRVEPEVNQAAAVLGGATASFALSGLVVAKYYSLGAVPDKFGRVGAIQRPQALAAMQASSRNRLRQTILTIQAQGYQPVMPIFHYRMAEGLAAVSQDPNDLVSGLSEYWLGSTLGRLMISLGR
ncbi:MAG: S16 family serine protease [Pseudomonadota bacterium]